MNKFNYLYTSHKFFFSFKLLYIIIFLLNISQITSFISFTYPTAVTLKNGNIFVIHKYGVSICDNSFITIINNITIFPAEGQISNEIIYQKYQYLNFKMDIY